LSVKINTLEEYKRRDYIQVDSSVELTEFCNLKCHYCCQGEYTHKKYKPVNFNIFKLVMTKFFKELSTLDKKVKLSMSVLGGELSVLYEQNKYFDYFNFIIDQSTKYNIELNLVLLTNFTGKLEFFQKFVGLKTNLVNPIIHATFHETYFTTEKKMISALNKIKELSVFKSFVFDLTFLESKSPDFIRMMNFFNKHRSLLPDYVNIIYDKLLKIGHNEDGQYGYKYESKNDISMSNIKYCNVLQYEFDFSNLVIIDQCRDIRSNILSWRLEYGFINCDMNCPYPSLWETFIQLSPKDYRKLIKN